MVEIQAQKLKEAQLLLRSVKNGFPKAVSRALNKSTAKARTIMRSKARQEYLITAQEFNQGLKIRRATWSLLNAQVRLTGKRKPLIEYRVNPSAPKYMGRGNLHKAKVFRAGSMHDIRGFTAKMQTGHVGVFERKDDKPHGEIIERYGPSIPQMVGNPNIIRVTKEEASKYLGENLDKEALNLLRGGR